jgi:hypothetical protein
MHQYGLHILSSIAGYEGEGSTENIERILFSHTDLNWNTVRYLQSCEGIATPSTTATSSNSSFERISKLSSPHFPSPAFPSSSGSKQRAITHLNFQLIPFPWFEKQQGPLYPTVAFPPLFKGVSTNRMSEGNSLLIQRLLVANLRSDRALFLDMQVGRREGHTRL